MTQVHRDTISKYFALLSGAGFIIWMADFFLGAVGAASESTLVLLFLFGAILFFMGIIGWLYRQQPFRNFDDINQPIEEEAH